MKRVRSCILISLMIFVTISMSGCSNDATEEDTDTPSVKTENIQTGTMPWENGGKQPSEYTWEEYQALSEEEKEAFSQEFSGNDFEEWMKIANGEVSSEYPWEDGGKQPSEYTWEEYQVLSEGEKEAFSQEFSGNDFEEWMKTANGEVSIEYPWENGGKQPSEYTWAEFQALNEEEKEAFSQEFSGNDFKEWMDFAQN